MAVDHEMHAMIIGKKADAKQVQQFPDWNGQEVWALLFYLPGEDIPCTGDPQFIVFSDTGYHITDPGEATEYLDYVNQEYGYDEDGDIIGYNQSEPVVIG